MDKTLVLIDSGFLSKLSIFFGKDKYLEFDIIALAKNLAKKQDLFCDQIFYYTAPPFQSESPSRQESARFKRFEKFTEKLSKNPIITIREGRCQRLKINNKFLYKQKAVDTLAIIDMASIPLDYPKISKIIIIASDSDFVPIIEKLRKLNVKKILYTYYDKKNRKSLLSTSNELIKSVYKYTLLTKKRW
jgi:uncharacterized LabA/DUF88 family protein